MRLLNPIQWLRANRARNLADYRKLPTEAAFEVGKRIFEENGVSETLRQAVQENMRNERGDRISEAARILGSSRDRDYEKRRRETTDAMREKAGLPPWVWQKA